MNQSRVIAVCTHCSRQSGKFVSAVNQKTLITGYQSVSSVYKALPEAGLKHKKIHSKFGGNCSQDGRYLMFKDIVIPSVSSTQCAELVQQKSVVNEYILDQSTVSNSTENGSKSIINNSIEDTTADGTNTHFCNRLGFLSRGQTNTSDRSAKSFGSFQGHQGRHIGETLSRGICDAETGKQSNFDISNKRLCRMKGTCIKSIYGYRPCLRGFNSRKYNILGLPCVDRNNARKFEMRGLSTFAGKARRDKLTKFADRGLSSWIGREDIRKAPPWRILYFGTDEFSLHHLQALNEHRTQSSELIETLDVVSVKAGKRVKLPVREYAKNSGLNLMDWPITVEHGHDGKYDVGVLVSFGHLIPERVINLFPYGIINSHPSLLPRWRGASPLVHTILNGDTETGISIMEIRPRHYDIGPLLMQTTIPVPERCTSQQLLQILAPQGADMVLESLRNLRTLERFEHEQSSRGVTYAHKILPHMGNIDWENHTCVDIDRMYRAFLGLKNIHLRTEWGGLEVHLMDMTDPDIVHRMDLDEISNFHMEKDLLCLVPGTVIAHKPSKNLLFKCKDSLVGFKKVRVRLPEKTRTMTYFDFWQYCLQHNRTEPCKSLPSHVNEDIDKEIPIRQAA